MANRVYNRVSLLETMDKILAKYLVLLGCCTVTACSTFEGASSLNGSMIDQSRRDPPPSRVVMTFDHREKYERSMDACYYLTPENSIGETIGVMVYADGCPESIIYDFSLKNWEPNGQ